MNYAGIQDILVIRPDLIDKTHLEIKKKTHKYICYLYDSYCTWFKIDNLLIDVFDSIYSFI
jgi:hypothetical protein